MSREYLTDKTKILARMAESHRAFRAAIDRAGPELLVRPATWGDWSLKDLIAHLTHWQGVATDRMQKFVTGRVDEIHFFQDSTESFKEKSEIDVVNEGVYQANKDRTLADMLAAFDSSYVSFRTAAKQIPAEVYPQDQQPSPVRNWIVGNGSAHYEEHVQDIDRAIQRQSS